VQLNQQAALYIYTSAHTHTHTRANTYKHTHKHANTHTHTHAKTHHAPTSTKFLGSEAMGGWACSRTSRLPCTFTQVHAHTHTHVQTHTNTHTHTNKHANTHTCKCTCKHTHTHANTHHAPTSTKLLGSEAMGGWACSRTSWLSPCALPMKTTPLSR